MKITIKSESATAVIDTHGAELVSLVKDDIEYLWQADPKVWNRHSPVLFPFICSVKDKTYTAGGKEYKMPWNHGFARDREFEVICRGEDNAVFSLGADEETKKCYPYEFELNISYRLVGNSLEVTYTAENNGDIDMYCYIGGHPGFNLPLDEGKKFDDYFVEYEEEEHISQPTPDGGKRVILDGERRMQLSHELFCYDVIMKDKPQSAAVTLRCEGGEHSVRLEFPSADCIAVWSPYRDDADFVCLEPWSSVPSYADDDFTAIEEKPHAVKIPPEGELAFTYNIIIE